MLTLYCDLLFDGERVRTEALSIDVADGVILAIRPLADPASPPPPGVYDARGALLMPGLINAHVHIARGGVFEPNERVSGEQAKLNLSGALAAGVTTVGDMGCAAPLIAKLRAHVEENPSSGPSIRASGPIVTAPRGYPLDWLPPLFTRLGVALPCETELDGARAAARVARFGMDHIKLAVMHQSYARAPIPAVSEPVARALVTEAHAQGLRVLAHAHSVADYRVALAAGVDALMHSSFEPLDDDTVRRIADAGIAVCPTLWVFESVCLGAEQRWDRQSRYTTHVLDYVAQSWRRFGEAYAASGDVIPPGIAGGLPKSDAKEAIVIAAANLRLLRAAGVPIAFGNDASYGFSLVARPVDELSAMQRAGMDAAACLQSATSIAARILGLDDRGRVAVGMRADFVVTEKSVLHDVAGLETPRAVFARGERVAPLDARAQRDVSIAFWRGIASTATTAIADELSRLALP